MNIQLKLPYKILSTSILCSVLTACGGGGSDGSIDDGIVDDGTNNPSGVSAGTIDSSNYLSVFQTGVTGSAKLLQKVMFTGDDIDPEILMILNSTATSRTYACNNTGGTILVEEVDSETQAWSFNNCHITSYTPDTRYDGTATVVTTMSTGLVDDLGSYLHDWSAIQTLAFNNYTETSPITGGSSSTSNGIVILGSSNDLIAQSYHSSLSTSTSFSIDAIDASGVATSYNFSDIFYSLFEDTSDDTVISDLEYTANISGIGDIEVTTNTPLPVIGTLWFDADGILTSGAGVVTTASSTAKMVSTAGYDSVEITLDPENDGSFEAPILTTWTALGGGG